MAEIETSTLKKITTRYDAAKIFKKSKMIFFYFRPKDKNIDDYKYMKFNPIFAFDVNFELCMKIYKNIPGSWYLYTNNEKYPIIAPNSNQIQLEMFN